MFVGKLSTVRMSVVPKLIYRFKAIIPKIPMLFGK